ncbi:MAG: ribonuclease E/G, partial [Clostridia bacterium]|nr:ribonuclease E/G [Clostridia bacterium]
MTNSEMDRILYVTPEGYAVAEDGALAEYLPKETAGETGAVFLGRVNRIMSGLSCAFVDIGRKRDGFLPLTENSRTFTGGAVRSGDLAAVQLRKEETGEKGAFLSRDLSLAGSLVILMPLNRFTGVSKRITDEATVRRLQALGRETAGDRFGLVMREASAAASEAEIREETQRLASEWTELEAAIREGKAPGLLRPEDTLSQLKRDYGRRGSFSIRTV